MTDREISKYLNEELDKKISQVNRCFQKNKVIIEKIDSNGIVLNEELKNTRGLLDKITGNSKSIAEKEKKLQMEVDDIENVKNPNDLVTDIKDFQNKLRLDENRLEKLNRKLQFYTTLFKHKKYFDMDTEKLSKEIDSLTKSKRQIQSDVRNLSKTVHISLNNFIEFDNNRKLLKVIESSLNEVRLMIEERKNLISVIKELIDSELIPLNQTNSHLNFIQRYKDELEDRKDITLSLFQGTFPVPTTNISKRDEERELILVFFNYSDDISFLMKDLISSLRREIQKLQSEDKLLTKLKEGISLKLKEHKEFDAEKNQILNLKDKLEIIEFELDFITDLQSEMSMQEIIKKLEEEIREIASELNFDGEINLQSFLFYQSIKSELYETNLDSILYNFYTEKISFLQNLKKEAQIYRTDTESSIDLLREDLNNCKENLKGIGLVFKDDVVKKLYEFF
jgi:hypothetical protein